MKRWLSPPLQIFVAVVLLLTGVVYALCDHYLSAFGRELMLSWAKSEAAAVQEGNLLTSVMKAQPYLMASDYVRGVRLFKVQNGFVDQKIGFGAPFDPATLQPLASTTEPVVQRVGFLHSRVTYAIPGKQDFVLVFDLNSPALVRTFLAVVWFLIFVLAFFVILLRRVERQEAAKREKLLKLALNDLIFHDASSEILDREFPDVALWWRSKKRETMEAQRLAVENKSRILLGETASRLVHDIKGPLRNIEILTKRMTGLSETHAEHLKNSIDKLSKLATSISDKTREVLQEEIDRKVNVDVANLVRRVVEAKTHEWAGFARIEATIDLAEVSCFIDPLELDRALCNLIDNAVESSPRDASVEIALSMSGKAIAIRITDQGCGIAPEHLQKLGSKGFTFGKNNGSGLGVYYAKKAAEDAGGTFDVSSSVGHGTTVELTLPAIIDAETSLPDFRSGAIDTVVFVDDSEFIHEITGNFLFALAGSAAKSMTVLSFRRPEEFRSWLANAPESQKHFAFVDYRFEDIAENGLDLIEQSRLQSRSALLTAFPDDSRIVSRAKALGVPVLFKEFVFSGPVGFI